MKLAAILGGIAGVAGFVGLLLLADPGQVWRMILDVGWWLGLLAAIHLVYILVLTFAWRVLLVGQDVHRPLWELYRQRWIADAVNALVPFLIAEGEALRGVLQSRETRVRAEVAAAVIVAELTARFLSLVIFVLIGLGLFSVVGTGQRWLALAGSAAGLVLLLGAYWWAQRHGWLVAAARRIRRRHQGGRWERTAGDMEEIDQMLPRIYGQHRRFVASAGLHFLAWVIGAAEILLVLHAIGRQTGPLQVWTLESIGQAVRNAGFFLPASMGAQEGGYALAAIAVGLGTTVGVGLSIIKRVRDLLIGLPALALWQWRELRRRRSRA